jgi:hypothetical protein
LIQGPQPAGLIQNSPDGLAKDDFVSTDRGQSTQCAAQHRPKNRRRQTAITAQRSQTGLTAETIVPLEDTRDYRAFEAAIIADYDARTAVERELVLRLASLLWRIRRATAIETDLLQIQAEILSDRRLELVAGGDTEQEPQSAVCRPSQRTVLPKVQRYSGNGSRPDDQSHSVNNQSDHAKGLRDLPGAGRTLTYCFLRLANLDNGVFERLGRYETALWRQIMQTLFVLQTIKHR